MHNLFLATAFNLSGATWAMAGDIIKVPTDKSVTEAIDALQAAVENAGATVFARVDHAAGAYKVDMTIRPIRC